MFEQVTQWVVIRNPGIHGARAEDGPRRAADGQGRCVQVLFADVANNCTNACCDHEVLKFTTRSFGILLHEVITGECPSQRSLFRPLRYACTTTLSVQQACSSQLMPQ